MTLIEHKKIWDADHPIARFRIVFICSECGLDMRTDRRGKTLAHALGRVGAVDCPGCGYQEHIYEPMSERERVRAGDEALAKWVAQ